MEDQRQNPVLRSEKKTLNLVQLMRAVASLLVVLFHVTSNTKDNLSHYFIGDIFFFGGSGVDIFFVISGFIITYTNLKSRNNRTNAIAFLERRFVRIYPIYWIIIGSLLCVSIVLPQFYNSQYQFSIGNLVGTFLLFPGHTMVNGVSWTLSFEIYFYLIFILVFFIRSNRFLFIWAMLYMLTIIFLPFFYTINDPWTNLVFHPMIIEFFLGISIVYIIPKINLNIARSILIIGILWFIAGACIFNSDILFLPEAFAEFQRVILFGFPAFLIMTGIIKLDLIKNVHVNKWIVLLGEASYTLYLIHLPIIAAALKIVQLSGLNNSLLYNAIMVGLIIFICLLSILIYKWIEKPIISKLKRNRQMI